MLSVWSLVVLCGMQRNTHSRWSCEEGVCVCMSASEECSVRERSRVDLSWICVIREIKVVGDFINPPSMPLTDPPDTIQASPVSVCVCVHLTQMWHLCHFVQLNYSVCFGLACAELLPHPSVCVNLKLSLSLSCPPSLSLSFDKLNIFIKISIFPTILAEAIHLQTPQMLCLWQQGLINESVSTLPPVNLHLPVSSLNGPLGKVFCDEVYTSWVIATYGCII